jgi:hypothetical protein
MVWKKDNVEVSDNAEILTISTKGNPPMVPLMKEEDDGKTAKPKMIMDMIEDNFGGQIVELSLG